MSSYEDYSRTAHGYDRTRSPVGIEIILGCLARVDTPLARQRVLDAGCGTGNYAAALLAQVAEVDALDLNPAMLAQAGRKLAGALGAGRARLHRAPLRAVPLADASVDAITLNQVLHHLPPQPGWSEHAVVLAELARVLRPGGVLVINTCSPLQLERAFWPYRLVPEALAQCLRRHAPLEVLEDLLEQAGLTPCGRSVPLDAVLQGEAYFDPRGPLDPRWRDGDSLWALVTPAALGAAERELRALDARGALQAWVDEQDRERARLGQTTFLCAERR